MFTFSVRILSLMLSRSWAQRLVIVLYKVYKEMDPGLARRDSPLCPSERTALFLFPPGFVFPHTCRFGPATANACIFHNVRVSALQQLGAKPETLAMCQKGLINAAKICCFNLTGRLGFKAASFPCVLLLLLM